MLGAGLCTGVQSGIIATDLRKVGSRIQNSNHEKSPSIVNGKLEMFCDVKSLICEWEYLEGNAMEWEEKEGRRRGGRRVSRRVSELLEKFEGGGGQEHEKLSSGSEIEVKIGRNNSSLSFETARFGKIMKKNESNSTYSQVVGSRISNGLKS